MGEVRFRNDMDCVGGFWPSFQWRFVAGATGSERVLRFRSRAVGSLRAQWELVAAVWLWHTSCGAVRPASHVPQRAPEAARDSVASERARVMTEAQREAKEIRFAELHTAAQNGRVADVERLLAAGAAVGASNIKGWTPLHCAARYGHVEVAEKLLAAGAAVGASNIKGWTPLHCAARYGHVEVAEKLLAAGAAVGAKDRDGKTPLDKAVQYNKPAVAALLREWRPENAGAAARRGAAGAAGTDYLPQISLATAAIFQSASDQQESGGVGGEEAARKERGDS